MSNPRGRPKGSGSSPETVGSKYRTVKCVVCRERTLRRGSRLFCSPACFREARRLLGSLYNADMSYDDTARLLSSQTTHEAQLAVATGGTPEVAAQFELERLRNEVVHLQAMYKTTKTRLMSQLDFAEAISKAARAAKEVEPPKPLKDTPAHLREAQTAVLELSDLHLGEEDSETETNVPGYDYSIFLEELSILRQKVLNIVRMHRMSHPINKLLCIFNGDFCSGHEVFPGQTWRTQFDVMLQILNGMSDICSFITWALGEFQEVEVLCVPGNHGSLRGREPSPTHVNFDFMLYHFAYQVLKPHNPRLKMKITPSWWTMQNIYGWNFYVDHGATFGRRWMGIPWYGIKRAEGELRRTLQVAKQLQKGDIKRTASVIPQYRKIIEECAPQILDYDINYLVLAHNHEGFYWREILANGAFSRGNFYAMKNFQTVSIPEQLLFGVHPRHGVTWAYRLRMDRRT